MSNFPAGVIAGMSLLLGMAMPVAKCTHENIDDCWRDQLTKSGHAEYYLDQNNQRQWHMKGAK